MAKPFWKGAISFGLVNIPVKMSVAAETTTSPGFHYLHNKCLTRPKQVLYCEKDDEYITTTDTELGYEYSKNQFVIFSDEDFEKVPVRTAHTIDIISFVKAGEIDPIFYYSSHYLEPDERGEKAFALLRQALIKTDLYGIAKVSFQRREHLVVLRPFEDILTLHSLHYQREIRPRGGVSIPEKQVVASELEMATSLISTMAQSFKPETYRDEYREALDTMIEAKIQGKEIKVVEAPASAATSDLMSALKASIEAAKKGKEKAGLK